MCQPLSQPSLCLSLIAVSCLVSAAEAGPRLVLNELMIRPVSGGTEWVELLNAGDAPALLTGLTLEDGRGRPARLALDGAPLDPQQFLIVAANRSRFLEAWIGLDAARVVGVTGGWPTLNDADGASGYADLVVLRDATGAALDSLAYFAAWLAPAGQSLERVDPAGASVLAANWSPATDVSGATPLHANSLAPRPDGGDRGALSVPAAPVDPSNGIPALVTWRLPGPSALSLELFDLSGRSCRLLRPLADAPAVGRVAWDGRDDAGRRCGDGVYVVVLEAREDGARPSRVWRRSLTLAAGAR